ncbi:MAG: UDP-N-acetylglucosamine 1-carboxyvinyltransferase, partial [Tissierellia bacterium]|nr:UDP-N-acetylglucosamine 1-carboxyvinyltransferase [Tissierellia bacterium]
MERMIIEKSPGLEGSIRVMGAKNSALPILAATLLGTEEIILEDVPSLKDVEVMIQVLQSLGSEVEYVDKDTLRIDASHVDKTEPPYELMTKMRASFLVLGPLLTRLGVSRTSMPGGCAIGARPIDLHLKGFRALGAEVEENDEEFYVEAAAKNGLVGDALYLDFPSVGATQNIIMAATLAKGETVIENAAKEPEIVDLCSFLN